MVQAIGFFITIKLTGIIPRSTHTSASWPHSTRSTWMGTIPPVRSCKNAFEKRNDKFSVSMSTQGSLWRPY